MRDRDTEGETVAECQENLYEIREAQRALNRAIGELQLAMSQYIENVADPDHQWYEEIGVSIQPGFAAAHKILEAKRAQLSRLESVWTNRLAIAEGDDDRMTTLGELDNSNVVNEMVVGALDNLTTHVTEHIFECRDEPAAWHTGVWQRVRDALDAAGVENTLLTTIKNLEVETNE